jgi:hypothetical protein
MATESGEGDDSMKQRSVLPGHGRVGSIDRLKKSAEVDAYGEEEDVRDRAIKCDIAWDVPRLEKS